MTPQETYDHVYSFCNRIEELRDFVVPTSANIVYCSAAVKEAIITWCVQNKRFVETKNVECPDGKVRRSIEFNGFSLVPRKGYTDTKLSLQVTPEDLA